MKVLHTADWHVGRTIRGLSREEEHRAVLGEIATLAEAEKVDLILINVFGESMKQGADDGEKFWLVRFDHYGQHLAIQVISSIVGSDEVF